MDMKALKEILYFGSAFFQVLGVAWMIFKDFFAWHKSTKKTGGAKHMTIRHPVIWVILIFGAFVTGAVGLWLVYHPPVVVAQNPQLKEPRSNPAPQTQAPTQAPVIPQQQQALPRKPAKKVPVPETIPPIAPTPAQPPTYGPQTCVGSACSQGPGSQATFNQYGEPRRLIKSDLLQGLSSILAANPGMVFILSNSDGDDLAQQLFGIFHAAKWRISIGTRIGQGIPDGVHLEWKGDSPQIDAKQIKIPDDRADVQALFHALRDSGVKNISGNPVPAMSDGQIKIEIGGIPQ